MRITIVPLLFALAACDFGEDDPKASQEPAAPTKGDTLFFPTGEEDSSPLKIVKEIPEQVRVGQPTEIRIVVTNQHKQPLRHIVVRERYPDTFKPAKGDYEVRQGTAVWHVGALGPGEAKTLTLKGTAQKQADLRFCTEVDALPELCVTRKVVVADLELSVKAPAQVLVCDPLDVRVAVRNAGSARLEGVVVEAPVPDGFKGDKAATADVGALEPGASKEVVLKLHPEKTGDVEGRITVKSALGTTAEATYAASVREPVLEISRSAEGGPHVGRPYTEEITVKNTSDVPSDKTTLRVTTPEGVEAEGKTEWDLGTIEPGKGKSVKVTWRSGQTTSGASVATAQGQCAKAVEARQEIAFKGVPAVMLEVVDQNDPVPLDREVTYTIAVTNQGTAPQTNVRITAEPPGTMRILSATGPTEREGENGKVSFKPLESLAPGDRAEWRVTVKAADAGDVRFRVQLRSDQLTEPAIEEEPTRFFK